jgi:hypothetical protein
MKIKFLTAAVSACILASQAMAVSITAKPVPDLQIVFSGATAVDNQFANYVLQTCNAGSLDTYTNSNDSASAFYCTVSAAKTGTVAMDILFRKESGGSSTGVVPISYGAAPAGQVAGLDMGTCVHQGNQEWNCSNTTITVQSQIGISDVEPELFALPANIKPGATGPIPAPMAVSPVNTQAFGIVVSPELRNALQAAQGLNVGSDEVADMPSLSSSIIANLFAGNIASWDQLKNDAGMGIAAAAGQTNDSVNVCVRTPGSGTQAQFNAFYMKNGCAYRGGGSLGPAFMITATDSDAYSDLFLATENNGFEVPSFFGFPIDAPYVYWNKGSSDVGKCLTKITTHATTPRWAIGVQSVEKVDEGLVDRNRFKYIAIDGIAPTLENVAAGLYHNVASASIQWNTNIVAAGSVTENLALEFVALAQDVSAVSVFNASLQDDGASSSDNRPVGGFRIPEILDGGVPANVGSLAFAQGALVAGTPFNPANPVTPFNKGLSDPSSCKVDSINGAIDVSQSGR